MTLSLHSQELDVSTVHLQGSIEMVRELDLRELFHINLEMALHALKGRCVVPDVALKINSEMESVMTGVKGVSKEQKAMIGSKGG